MDHKASKQQQQSSIRVYLLPTKSNIGIAINCKMCGGLVRLLGIPDGNPSNPMARGARLCIACYQMHHCKGKLKLL